MKTPLRPYQKALIIVAAGLSLPTLFYFGGCGVPFPGAFESKIRKTGESLALALLVSEGSEDAFQSCSNANEYLAKIVDEISSERLFFVSHSPWHGQGDFQFGVDSQWESTTPPGIALQAGENAFAVNRAGRRNRDAPYLLTVTTQGNDRRRLIIVNFEGKGEILKLEEDETFEPGSTTILDRFPDADWLLPLPPEP